MLAARLRAELLDELDRLEERHWTLRAHIRRARRQEGLESSARADVTLGPDSLGNLHAEAIKALRARVEEAYDGLEALSRHQLETRCLTLTGIAADVGALVAEIESRAATWGLQVGKPPVAGRGVGARRPTLPRLEMA